MTETANREFRRVDTSIETESHTIRIDAVMLERLDGEARLTVDYELLSGPSGLDAGTPFVETYADGPIDPKYDDWSEKRLREQGIPHRRWRRVARTRPIGTAGSISMRIKRAEYILGGADRVSLAVDGQQLENGPLNVLIESVYGTR